MATDRLIVANIAIMKEPYETMADISFEVLETFWSGDGAIVKWNFHFRMGEGKKKEE